MATAKTKTTKASEAGGIIISAPQIQSVKVKIIGTAPLCMARFSEKAMRMMEDKMTGVTKKGTRVRENRNFDEDYENAKHISQEGWVGFPASGLRAAMIRACTLVGYKMTQAKISVFVVGESIDKVDKQPLFQIFGTPEQNHMPTRNATGVFDIRVRPLWTEWYAEPTIQFDGDQFGLADVINLLNRAGMQCGLGEGRPNSRQSAGLGWGTFRVESPDDAKAEPATA